VRIGEELREARLAAGLMQRQVGDAAGISHGQVSRLELGRAPHVPFETLAVMAAVLGLDLPLRTFASGDPIRDVAQVALLARLRALLPSHLT
jgi:transcriptional regulator with XRE-family HTH domain